MLIKQNSFMTRLHTYPRFEKRERLRATCKWPIRLAGCLHYTFVNSKCQAKTGSYLTGCYWKSVPNSFWKIRLLHTGFYCLEASFYPLLYLETEITYTCNDSPPYNDKKKSISFDFLSLAPVVLNVSDKVSYGCQKTLSRGVKSSLSL